MLSVPTGRMYVNLLEVCSKCVRIHTENVSRDTRPHEASMCSRSEEKVKPFARKRRSSADVKPRAGLFDPPLHPSECKRQTRVRNFDEPGRGSKEVKTERPPEILQTQYLFFCVCIYFSSF